MGKPYKHLLIVSQREANKLGKPERAHGGGRIQTCPEKHPQERVTGPNLKGRIGTSLEGVRGQEGTTWEETRGIGVPVMTNLQFLVGEASAGAEKTRRASETRWEPAPGGPPALPKQRLGFEPTWA